jgi:hypothetical protein
MKDLRNKVLKQKKLKQKYAQIVVIVFLSQSLSFALLPAFADGNSIKIAGQPIFTISSAGDTGSIAKRTEIIQDNLDNALVAAKDRAPSSVNIAYVKGTPVITLGGYQVVTVSASDATAAKTTPALLANQWANKIRNSLVDQNSINSYIAHLSGTYVTSAPAPTNNYQANNPTSYGGRQMVGSAPLPQTAPNYPQQQNNFAPSNQPYDSYNANSYGGPPGGNQNYNSGYGNYGQQNPPGGYYQGGGGQGYRQGRIAYAQVGQIIPVTLATSIATQVARTGDLIQANVSQNVYVGDSVIPAGSQVLGQVTDARAGSRLTRSGELQLKFNRLRLPDGTETPINAHIVGSVAKYAEVGGDQSDQFKGETMKNKIGSVAFRGLIGTGGGAALGTAVGAIAGGGSGAGRGAWSGAAIGAGLGVADSLILRKGKDVTIPSGTALQLQLDSPVAISGVNPAGYQ